MDIHKSLLPRAWHVTRVTPHFAGTRDGVSDCDEPSCQPRQEFHSESHNASRALLVASLADGGFFRGKAHADVTSGTRALCGWQTWGEERKQSIEQRTARTEKQQQRNGWTSKGAGLSSGSNGHVNDNFVFHHYQDCHQHMQHYRYYHTVNHAGRACEDLLHLDAMPLSTSGLDSAQEQSRKPSQTPPTSAATATLPQIKTDTTTTITTSTTITTTTTSTTVTTPFVLARAATCSTAARLLICADVSLSNARAPRAVTSPSILSSLPHRREVSWSWGQYKQFCRLREALIHRHKRRVAVRRQDVGDFPRAGDDKGDNLKGDPNLHVTTISVDNGAGGVWLSTKKDFQKVVKGPVFGFANDLMQNSELCVLSGTDGRCEADSSQYEVLRYIVSQAKRQTVGVPSTPASPIHNPPPVDDATAVNPVSHTVKRLECDSHQHRNSHDNIRSVGFTEDPKAPETSSINVSLEYTRLPDGDGKSASGQSGCLEAATSSTLAVRTRENDLWTASDGTYANRFSQIDWFANKKKGLGEKPLPDGTHDKNENPDKKLGLDSETSAANSRNLKSNFRKICDGSASEDKQADLEKRSSKPGNKKVGAACERRTDDGLIRKSPVKSAMYCPFKARSILPNKHLDGASGMTRSSTTTSKSVSTKPFSSLPAVGKSFVPKAFLQSPVKNGSAPCTGEWSLPKPKPDFDVRASYIVPAEDKHPSTTSPLRISSLCLHTSKTTIKSRSPLNFQLNSESRKLLSCADEASVVCHPLPLKFTPTRENPPPLSAIFQVLSLHLRRKTKSHSKEARAWDGTFYSLPVKHFTQKTRSFHGQSIKNIQVKRGSVQSQSRCLVGRKPNFSKFSPLAKPGHTSPDCPHEGGIFVLGTGGVRQRRYYTRHAPPNNR